MIPTRLHQPFKNGVVLGFNRESGSVIVVTNHYTIASFDLSNIEQTIEQSSNLEHGYGWPTISDCEAIAIEFLTRVFKEQSSLHYYLVSRTIVSVYGDVLKMIQLAIHKSYSNTSFEIMQVLVPSTGSNGIVLPVLYINGNNC